jgi:hypothetical protein
VNELGFQTQGRYLLPLMVSACVVAAHVIARRLPDRRAAVSLVRTTALVTLPIHLVFLVFAMLTWQSGTPGKPFDPVRMPLNPLRGHWHPPLGSVTVLALGVIGAVALLVVAWRAVPAEDGHDPDRTATGARAVSTPLRPAAYV